MKTFINFAKTLVISSIFTAACAFAAENTVVDVAANNKDFSTLVTALKEAGLVDTLKTKGPFTVFAPTNEAFNKLPAGTLDNLLKPENKKQLQDILKYHVVSGKVTSAEIKEGTSEVYTLEGKSLTIKKTASGVKVNNADVVKADIDASNGVVHVIDQVLIPSNHK